MLDPAKPVIHQILTEQNQGHPTRIPIMQELESLIGRPILSFFTSLRFPVMIENTDADILEGLLQKMDLSKGLALIINSPGGDGLAAERIINICRTYSGTNEYWAIVGSRAKSAATMICFGASKIIMGPTSELGPVDPQLTISDQIGVKRFSAYNVIKSYEKLFERAVQEEEGNLQPYLQQLANYDERDIMELKAALALSEDIAIRALESGMMKGHAVEEIKQKIKIFLTPERTKTHGRGIYPGEATSCGLIIETPPINDKTWETIYHLYTRTNHFVSTKASKCIETKSFSFYASTGERDENRE